MTKEPEDIVGMDMPCMCVCGEWFDLNSGNTCDACNKIFCIECVEKPFGLCQQCVRWADQQEGG